MGESKKVSGAQAFEDSQRANGIQAVQLAMRQLREFWSDVSISVFRTDNEGNTASYELEYDSEDEDDEDKKV